MASLITTRGLGRTQFALVTVGIGIAVAVTPPTGGGVDGVSAVDLLDARQPTVTVVGGLLGADLIRFDLSLDLIDDGTARTLEMVRGWHPGVSVADGDLVAELVCAFVGHVETLPADPLSDLVLAHNPRAEYVT